MNKPKYIEAGRFVECFGNWYTEEGTENGFIGTIKDLVEQMPAADVVEVRHGRWKCVSIGRYACSLCGREPWYEGSINTMHYCPNCGAAMIEEEEA